MENTPEAEEKEEMEFSSEEKQNARAFLRERYLRVVSGLIGSECELTLRTSERNTVSGVFQGVDTSTTQVLVDDLKTPFATVPHSIVRETDIVKIDFPKIPTAF